MREFLLVFRRDLATRDLNTSPEQMQALWKAWRDWMGSVATQYKLVGPGKRLGTEGRVVKPNKLVTSGPYVELKEAVAGYMFIRADSLDEAAELSKECPNLTMGGTVEVRPIEPESDRS